MTDPTPAAFFNEAAREAAAWAITGCQSETTDRERRTASLALAAALKALPERSKAILALAALSDEELVERVASIAKDNDIWSYIDRRGFVQLRSNEAVTWRVLTALGLPVAEREATG